MRKLALLLRRYWWVPPLCISLFAATFWGCQTYFLPPSGVHASVRYAVPFLSEEATQDDAQPEMALLKSYPLLEQVARRLTYLQEGRFVLSDATGRYAIPPARFASVEPREYPPDVLETLQMFRSVLEIERAAGDILDIRVRANPMLPNAEAIANMVAEEYARLKRTDTEEQIQRLERQLADTSAQVERAGDALQTFLDRHPQFVPGVDIAPTPEQETKLQAEWDALDTQIGTLRDRKEELERLSKEIASSSDPVQRWDRSRSLIPALEPSPALDRIESLEDARMRLLQRYTLAHPIVRGNGRQLVQARSALASDISGALANRMRALDRQLAELASQKQRLTSEPGGLDDQRQLQSEYENLTGAVDDQSERYDQLMAQIQERKREVEALTDETIVRKAAAGWIARTEPWFPVYGGVIGLLIAVGCLLLLARRPEPPESTVAWRGASAPYGKNGLPVLGRIPELGLGKMGPEVELLSTQRNRDEELDLLLSLSPPARLLPGTDAFRCLRTQILFHDSKEIPPLLVFASPTRGEGVSTVVANLAVAVAQAGKKTLLVDSDMRDPQLHDAFGLSRKPGLTDVLLESARMDEAVQDASDLLLGEHGPDAVAATESIGNLHFLFAGAPADNAAELLSTPTFKELLGSLKEFYDFILLDGGALEANPETHTLAAQAEGVILVHCPHGRRTRKSLAAAIEALRVAPVWGAVLNELPREFR